MPFESYDHQIFNRYRQKQRQRLKNLNKTKQFMHASNE